MAITFRSLTLVGSLALVAAACGSDDTATPATTASAAVSTTSSAPTTTTSVVSTTTAAPAPTPTVDAYASRGPYAVGVTTLQLPDGPLVEVWYPADASTSGTDTYDVRDFTPEAIRSLLTGDVPATFTIDAARDAAVLSELDNGVPLVLFSHGYTGMRVQSSFLTSHLASWGFVVAAPDHSSRDLTNVLGGTASGDRAESVADLLGTLDLLTAASADAASPFHQLIDLDSVAAVGHSAGGGTVLGAAADERVDGYVSLASGAFDAALPDKPSFFMAGSLDAVVTVAERTRPAFDAAPSPKLLWVIEGAGHNAFDDFCTFGNGTGIIGIAEASGLGPLLDAQPQLRSLGEDGCVPPAVPVTTTFPLINHGVTAWLRHLFGIDAEPVGLGEDVSGAYGVAVEVVGAP